MKFGKQFLYRKKFQFSFAESSKTSSFLAKDEYFHQYTNSPLNNVEIHRIHDIPLKNEDTCFLLDDFFIDISSPSSKIRVSNAYISIPRLKRAKKNRKGHILRKKEISKLKNQIENIHII